MAAIKEYLLPLGVTLPQPSRAVVGGYFIWLTLPAPLQAEEVAILAKRDANLVIAPGHIFAVYGDEKVVDLERKVRICFSWEEEGKVTEGIRRLGHVISRMQNINRQQTMAVARPSGDSSTPVDHFR